MAEQGTVRNALRLIHRAVVALAAERGWGEDYHAYVYFNMDIGHTFLLIEAPSFGGGHWREQWDVVYTHMEKYLKADPMVRQGFHLFLQTFDQTAEGGVYEIREPYQPLEDLLTPSMLRP